MLILFSRICLFLFLKLKILKTPNKIKTTVEALIVKYLPRMSKSCAVILRKTVPNTAKNIQTVCILCNIFDCKSFKKKALNLGKIKIIFAQFKN